MNEQSCASISSELALRVDQPEAEPQSAAAVNTTSAPPPLVGVSDATTEWRDIPDFPMWQASVSGAIRTKQPIVGKGRWKTVPSALTEWRVAKQHISSALGYPYVNIYQRGTIFVHRIVAETFIPKPEGIRLEVNHKNGVKHDNRVDNLEWVTRRENCIHKCQTLKVWQGESCTMSKLREIDARYILTFQERTFRVGRALAKSYGISFATIQDLWAGRTWKHLHK